MFSFTRVLSQQTTSLYLFLEVLHDNLKYKQCYHNSTCTQEHMKEGNMWTATLVTPYHMQPLKSNVPQKVVPLGLSPFHSRHPDYTQLLFGQHQVKSKGVGAPPPPPPPPNYYHQQLYSIHNIGNHSLLQSNVGMRLSCCYFYISVTGFGKNGLIAGLIIFQKRHLLSSSIAYAKYECFTKLCFNATILNSRSFTIITFLMFEENAFRVHC